MISSVSDLIKGHENVVVQAIQLAVKQLLESKHLYQSVDAEVEKFSTSYLLKTPSAYSHAASQLRGAHFWPWLVNDTDSFQTLVATLAQQNGQRTVTWYPPDVKLFCKTCARLEPFNGISGSNVLNRSKPLSGGIYFKEKLTQVFCLSYLCQSCKTIPEVFLIRRIGSRFSLCGRAPIEHTQAPAAIPKAVASYFSDALIAHQSGQTLAGLFMLRTLCEQWTRQYATESDKADVALEKYMSQLPEDFKNRFPSLRTIYGDLSSALHRADGSTELFETSKTAIEEHFTARTLFKL